jgi:hypothetical protein
MLRKIALAIAYFIAIIHVLLIVLPGLYCYQHGCKGPGEYDAFMPAFILIPASGIATAFAWRNAMQNIRKKHSWSWAFWPLAFIFGALLLSMTVVVVWVVYETVHHR